MQVPDKRFIFEWICRPRVNSGSERTVKLGMKSTFSWCAFCLGAGRWQCVLRNELWNLPTTFGFLHLKDRVGVTLFLSSFLFTFLPSDNFLSLIFCILNIFSIFIENKIICCSSLCCLHIRVTFLVYS